MARKKTAPASETATVDPLSDAARLEKTKLLYALAGDPDRVEEFEALRDELAAL